jgi:hypothetical protein
MSKITVYYSAIDGARETKTFKTMEKAREYSIAWVGEHAEFGSGYAISDDGIGKIQVEGASLYELFGRK